VACPVFAEFAEQVVLNRIPLRRSGWVMRDSDGETMAIAQAMLGPFFQAREFDPLLPPPSARIARLSASG